MNRRQALQALLTGLFSYCGVCGAQGWPSSTPSSSRSTGASSTGWPSGTSDSDAAGSGQRRSDPRRSQTRRSAFGAVGCYLAGARAGATGLRLFPWTGNRQVDFVWQREGLVLIDLFRVSPSGGFMDDRAAPNAFATPKLLFPGQAGQDGTVIFGMYLFTREVRRDGAGFAIPAILAHEFGHILQFQEGIFEPGPRMELQADYLAGWYLSQRRRLLPTDVRPAFQAFFEIGDYQFNDPQHHGTPHERLSAILGGAQSGHRSIREAFRAAEEFVNDLKG